jgi:hypothetical protein
MLSSVAFSENNWLHSHDGSLLKQSDGTIEWTPKKPHTILLNLEKPLNLSSIGDKAEFNYKFKSVGDSFINGCMDKKPEPCRTGCKECPSKGSENRCHAIGCNFDDDVGCLAGTGDFRFGMFDSNGKGYVKGDKFGTGKPRGSSNKIFKGYLGYQWRFHPHICDTKRFIEVKKDCSTEPHSNVASWKREFPTIKPCSEELLGDCDPRSWKRIFDPTAACFNLAQDTFGDLKVSIEVVAKNQLKVRFLLNGVAVEYVDKDRSNQPKKIDVISLHMSNARPYKSVTLKRD